MNNKIITALLLFLALWAYRLWVKISAVQRFNYRSLLPRNIRFESGALKFELEIVIVNPTTERVTVDGLDLNVVVGKTLLGKAIIFKPVTILPYTETTLQTSVIVGIDTLLTVIPDIKLNARTVSVTFDGLVRAYGLTAPVKLPYTLTIPRLF